MTTAQAFTTTETENLLVSVCRTALTGVLPAGSVWLDEPGSGRKAEPYVRINANGERDKTGLADTHSYSEPTSPGGNAVQNTQRDRVLPVRFDFIGPGCYELARQFADSLDMPNIREMFWAKGVGLVNGVKGPMEVPYTEGMQRKYYYRVQITLSLSESSATPANWIQYVEVSAPGLGIPVETIELTGGEP